MNALFCLACYLFGALPIGYLVVRWREKRDIRDIGSRSTGAANVLRTAGWALALPVLLVDVSKGLLPVLLGRHVFPGQPLMPLLGSLAAVLGHCYPVTLRFRGGKGVAAAMGAFAGLGFHASLLSLAVFLCVILLTRFVSLGSLLAAVSYPFFRLALGTAPDTLLWAWWAALLAVIVIRHWGNIRRLLAGQERKFGRRAREAAG